MISQSVPIQGSLDPFVVWPAPGLPALVDGSPVAISIVLALRGPLASDPQTLMPKGWQLRSRHVADALQLEQTGDVRVLDRSNPTAVIADFSRCADHRHRTLVELPLRATLLPNEARRSVLFDLYSDRGLERPRCVASFGDGDDLRIAFASDVHVAALWDEVADIVARYAPDLNDQIAHPGTNLQRFIDDSNERARRGELDLVVFGGDLIDHVYAHRADGRSQNGDLGNVPAFAAALDRLEVPSFVLPGNHDYRLFRWRPRAYGLEAARIPARRLPDLLKRAGVWDPMRLRWRDRIALQTEERGSRAPLAEHLRELAPSTNHTVHVRGTRLVLLNSGRDILPRWQSVERSRYRLLLRSIPGSWADPDSEGLDDEQLRLIAEAIDTGDPTAVFCHAPLLATLLRRPIADLVPELRPDRFGSALDFEDHLSRAGARTGVLFHGLTDAIRHAQRSRAPLTWFSGHVHRNEAFRMHRASGRLESIDPSGFIPAAAAVDFVQTPSLGLHGTFPENHPGWILATLREGRLVDVSAKHFTPRVLR